MARNLGAADWHSGPRSLGAALDELTPHAHAPGPFGCRLGGGRFAHEGGARPRGGWLAARSHSGVDARHARRARGDPRYSRGHWALAQSDRPEPRLPPAQRRHGGAFGSPSDPLAPHCLSAVGDRPRVLVEAALARGRGVGPLRPFGCPVHGWLEVDVAGDAVVAGVALDWSNCYDHFRLAMLVEVATRVGLPLAIAGPIIAASPSTAFSRPTDWRTAHWPRYEGWRRVVPRPPTRWP